MSIRIANDFAKLNKDMASSDTRFVAFSAPGPDDIYKPFYVAMKGPDDTPYEGGIFVLSIKFPSDYPFSPPKIEFKTPIYHPNINSSGSICIDILKDGWSASYGLVQTLTSISALLGSPNPNDPLVTEIANLYKTDIKSFETAARNHVNKYAKKFTGFP